MAISNASRLSDFGSGIGTQGAVLKVDNTNKRVGIGTTNPAATLEVGSGSNIIMDGNVGVITAQEFVGGGSGLTGVANTDYINSISVNASGIITASSFEGSGANLTGVSGFGTAVNSTAGTLGNLVYKTPREFYATGVGSAYLISDATSGNMLFTRLDSIRVGTGFTVHVGSGTTVVMDVLNIFKPV